MGSASYWSTDSSLPTKRRLFKKIRCTLVQYQNLRKPRTGGTYAKIFFKMKRIFLKALTGILIAGTMASCTQNDEIEDLLVETETHACCGEGDLDPPPPPPPPGGGLGG